MSINSRSRSSIGWLLIVGAVLGLGWTKWSHQPPRNETRPLSSAIPDTGRDKATDPMTRPASLKDLDSLFSAGLSLGQDVSRAGDEILDGVAGLTTKEEIRIGARVNGMMSVSHSLIHSPTIEQRIVNLAKPLLVHCRRKEIQYHFCVIESKDLNAFSHLGGYVYIHRGLLDAAKNDRELQFILAHEIAHCDLRHGARGMTAAVRVGELAGDVASQLAAVIYRNVAVGYSEEFEFDADLWAYDAMRAAGCSHEESLSGLKLLLDKVGANELHQRPFETVARLEDHFRTHPPTTLRIAKLEQRRAR